MDINRDLKLKFKEFCSNEFKDRECRANENNKSRWFYVQAGTKFGNKLHYELNNGYVELHFESNDTLKLNEFLISKLEVPELKWEIWQNNQNCRCRLDNFISIETELLDAFIKIRNIFEPLIMEFEQENKNENSLVLKNFIPTQGVIKLNELVKEKLIIPIYQRPYKWTEKNVIQLLEDIFEYVIVKNKNYRIGNIILHSENATNNVVDGQQRLTTISLILKILESSFNSLLLNEKFKHTISKNNIVYNYRIIFQWISTKFGNDESKKNDFKAKILNKCEFVLFTVFQQDEAFQLFDSQNSRGKALEPYDLLKAFHLREMDFDSEDDRTKCVERWEASVDNGTLKPILGNHLFKIRKWSKNEWKYDFTKEEIEEFKGISLHQKQRYPYESAMRMLDGFVDNAQNDKFLRNLQVAQTFPFQITTPIINGKRFFEYVDFYITQREKLFDLNKEDSIKAVMPEFVKFYDDYCKDYYGWLRSGDEKVRNLYENILLAFIDKFGYVDDFENFSKAFYKLAYLIRCEKKRITVETIMNSSARQVFRIINDSVSPDTFKNYQYKTYQIDKNNLVNGIDEIAKFITGEKNG